MKIKLKSGVVLPNNWKSCGLSYEDWENLNSGKSIDVASISELIKNDIDVVESASQTKIKKGDK
jgi:hypothetical protein